MIDHDHEVPVTRQAQLLDLSRSSLYYVPVGISAEDFEFMRLIDELHLKHPFAGARMLRDMLKLQGYRIGRRHVARLMRLMGLEALYRRRKTSRPHPEHRVFPYLLRGLTIDRPNHVWAADITYIPMRAGFLYLVAILDWATRRVLTWRLSNSLESSFCIDALEEAIAKYGCPEIFNTDQGAQFTDADFIKSLKGRGIEVSMDGKGAWRDNVFVERFWRTIKYEHVYLHAYENGSEARTAIAGYIEFYNTQRPHSSLDGCTPDTVYFSQGPTQRAA
jgi:putative transposase